MPNTHLPLAFREVWREEGFREFGPQSAWAPWGKFMEEGSRPFLGGRHEPETRQ